MVFVWIGAYGLVYTLASRMRHGVWLVPMAMLLYFAALMIWLFRTGRAERLGIAPIRKGSLPLLLPLLLLPMCNYWTAPVGFIPFPQMLLMLSVCGAEELFFRGYLLRRLQKYGFLPAAICSSLLFALAHLVNLTRGNPGDVCRQVLCALAVGSCYAATAVCTGSILLSFLAHFLTNITALPGSTTPPGVFWLCVIVYGSYGVLLSKRIIAHKECRNDEFVH